MKKMTVAELDKRSMMTNRGWDHEWIRVSLDTGGIAAGADEVFNTLKEETTGTGSDIEVLRTGSVGISYLDPVIEVKVEGMPCVIYGNVDETTAQRVISEHVGNKKLIDEHVVATKDRATEVTRDPKFILVKDTNEKSGDKSQFFQISFMEELKREGLAEKIQVVRALDMGIYDEGVVVQILPEGIVYTNVLAQDVARIVKTTIQEKKVVENLLVIEPDKQEKIVLRNCGIIDPESIDSYLRHNGYQGLKKAIQVTPEKVIEEMKKSGLRGRGGAGFPTWLKWSLTREVKADTKYVICNADEGDPGAFMDRSVLEGDPHSVLEGLAIAAYAIGAKMGYFYIRAEYPLAVERIQKAIDEAREKGLIGKNILGSDFSFDAKIRLGAGAFVCGEETALIASIEGKRGSPSPRPPYPSVKGLWGKPTSINNVETLANVPVIIENGGDWYGGFGTEQSKGTKVFAVTGKVKNAQLVEVPMGISLREIVYDICGGVLDDAELKGVQTGGPSGGVIPEQHLDTPVSYETLRDLGSIMGSGGMLVMDVNDCMVDVAKFYLKFCVDESCGKCAPCRVGGYQLLQLLDKISKGQGEKEDFVQINRICSAMQKASLCALGQTAPNPVLSTLHYFKNEFDAYIEGGRVYARKMERARAGGETRAKAG